MITCHPALAKQAAILRPKTPPPKTVTGRDAISLGGDQAMAIISRSR